MTGFGHFPWQTQAKQTGSNQQSFNFDHPLSFSHSLSELNLRSAYKVAESVATGITGRSDFLNLPMVTNLDIYAVVPHDDAHSQVIAAEYDRLLRGVRGASTGEVCSNIQGRRSVVK